MTDWVGTLPGIIASIVRGMRLVAALAIFFLALITIIDVVGRNTGLFAVRGILELTFLAMIIAGSWALPHCFLRGEHIVVEIATQKAPKAVNRALDGLWLLLGGLFLGWLAYLTWDESFVTHATGQRSQSLDWSPHVFHLPISFGYAVVTVTAIIAIWGAWRHRRRKRDGSA